jgi:hypothetical protein
MIVSNGLTFSVKIKRFSVLMIVPVVGLRQQSIESPDLDHNADLHDADFH